LSNRPNRDAVAVVDDRTVENRERHIPLPLGEHHVIRHEEANERQQPAPWSACDGEHTSAVAVMPCRDGREVCAQRRMQRVEDAADRHLVG
jgi:hypothetical protein